MCFRASAHRAWKGLCWSYGRRCIVYMGMVRSKIRNMGVSEKMAHCIFNGNKYKSELRALPHMFSIIYDPIHVAFQQVMKIRCTGHSFVIWPERDEPTRFTELLRVVSDYSLKCLLYKELDKNRPFISRFTACHGFWCGTVGRIHRKTVLSCWQKSKKVEPAPSFTHLRCVKTYTGGWTSIHQLCWLHQYTRILTHSGWNQTAMQAQLHWQNVHVGIFCIITYPEWLWKMVVNPLQCEAPKIAKLVYNSNNYGLWYL